MHVIFFTVLWGDFAVKRHSSAGKVGTLRSTRKKKKKKYVAIMAAGNTCTTSREAKVAAAGNCYGTGRW